MTCWFCGIPVSDPPAGILMLEGGEAARVCAKHSRVMATALRGLWGFRHFARVWLEKRAAAALATQAAVQQKAAQAGGGGGSGS